MSQKDFSYALTNPLSVILNKPGQDFQRADFLKIIEHKQIERITFHYTALDGKPKELRLPFSSRCEAESILADGERVDGCSLFKGMIDVSLSDLYVVPEYKTAFLNPFDNKSLDFVCRFLMKEGNRAPFAVDNILAKAYQLFRRKLPSGSAFDLSYDGFRGCFLCDIHAYLLAWFYYKRTIA